MSIQNNHLFSAFFEDGTRIDQNIEDVSSLDPSRNCFFDVLEQQKKSRLISFILVGPFDDSEAAQAGRYNVFGVDLVDGHFEVNKIPFHPFRVDRLRYGNYEIVFLRNNRHDKTFDIHNQTGAISNEREHTTIGYTIGYKAELLHPKPKQRQIDEFIIKI